MSKEADQMYKAIHALVTRFQVMQYQMPMLNSLWNSYGPKEEYDALIEAANQYHLSKQGSSKRR